MNAAEDRLTRIRLGGLARTFGEVRALTNVSADICAGDVVAVMGANGAGKSTLLSLLATTMRPTSGKILFNDRDAHEHGAAIRAQIGHLSHAALVYPDLTAKENLLFYAALYDIRDPSRIDALRDQMALDGFFDDRPARVLSRGQLQRLALARAFINRPSLLLLDEPAAGLDGAAINRIKDSVDAHRSDGGICVVVTHEPELASRIATRLWVIHRGRLAADESCPKAASEIPNSIERACNQRNA